MELAAGAVANHFLENPTLYSGAGASPFSWMAVFGTVALNLNMHPCQGIALHGGLLNSREIRTVTSLSHELCGGKGGWLFEFGSATLRRKNGQRSRERLLGN